jgi:hypothetical protein
LPRRNTDWDDDRVEPIRGPKRPAEFFKSNFKLMGVGGVFRTPKAKFSPKTIHAEAKKAGVRVRVDEEGLWHRVTIVGKLSKTVKIPRPDVSLPKPSPISDIFS